MRITLDTTFLCVLGIQLTRQHYIFRRLYLSRKRWDREPSPVPCVLSEHKEPSPVFLCSMVLTNMGQGTVPCPILSMCRNVDFIQGAGKIIPRALVVGFNWAFHRGTENRPLSHTMCVHSWVVLYHLSQILLNKSESSTFIL